MRHRSDRGQRSRLPRSAHDDTSISLGGDGGAWRLAIVLWKGDIGGAEILSISLAKCLREFGAETTIVFVGDPEPLAARVSRAGVRFTSIGLSRGRSLLRHPRRYVTEVTRAGPDGAILVECGFMGATLRACGYHAPIIGVEHGAFNEQPHRWYQRVARRAGRVGGAWGDDVEVAVSDFVLRHMRNGSHATDLVRIYNGIDIGEYSVAPESVVKRRTGEELIVGVLGRLIAGKGHDHLVRAVAATLSRTSVRLVIGGSGPERRRITALADELGVRDRITFTGVVTDVSAFWQRCDVAAIPSAEWIETFSMATLEAMACGKPVVASRNGAVPELVVDGETGILVAPADVEEMADALGAYGEDVGLRGVHGEAGRARASRCFDIREAARAYLDVVSRFHGRAEHQREGNGR